MCLKCAPQKLAGSDEYYTFSFFEDVVQNGALAELTQNLQKTVQRAILKLHKKLQRWKKYHILWTKDKKTTIEKLIQSDPPLSTYDDKFLFYADIITKLKEESDFLDIGPMRLNKRPLLNQISEHAHKWKLMLGEKLIDTIRIEMLEFKGQLDVRKMFFLVKVTFSVFKIAFGKFIFQWKRACAINRFIKILFICTGIPQLR